MPQNKKTTSAYSSLTGIHRAVPIILFAVAVFTMFCYITQDIGALGHAISAVFLGLFSCGAYAIPLLLALHAIFYPSDILEHRVASRVIFSVIAITFISALSHSITHWNGDLSINAFDAAAFFTEGMSSHGGGFIGGAVGVGIVTVFGRIGLVIIAAATLAIYVSYFFASGKRSVSKVLFNILKAVVYTLAFIERCIKKLFGGAKRAKTTRVSRAADQKSFELTDDEFFAVDNGMQRLSVSELGIRETRTASDIENPTLHEKVFYKSAVSAEEAEIMAMREKAEEMFEAMAENVDDIGDIEEEIVKAQRRRLVNVTYDDPDSKIGRAAQSEPVAADPVSVKVEYEDPNGESADSVFTQSFDPFSMVMAEELASKPSSRSLLDEGKARKVLTEDVTELTEAEVEREKRILEFERRKAAILSARRAVPVDNDGEFTGTPKNVEFRERNEESLGKPTVETEVSSFTIDKAERIPEPPKTTPANYTAIGFGTETESFSTVVSKPAFEVPETIYSYTPQAEESTTVTYGSYSETAPASAPYVEEEASTVYERRAYDDASYTEINVGTNPFEASEKSESKATFTMGGSFSYEEKEEFSYTSTKNFNEEKTEEFVPNFQPYQVATPEEMSKSAINVIDLGESNNAPEEVSTLKIEREYVGEEETVDIDELLDDGNEIIDSDEDEDESETEELVAPPEDDGDAYETDEIPPEERNPVVQTYKDMFSALRTEEPEDEEDEDEGMHELVSPDEIEEETFDEPANEEDAEDDLPPFEHSSVKHEPKPRVEKKEEKPEKKKPDFSNYKTPPIDLLGLDPVTDDDTSEINENTKILIDTLASFNVTASIKGVDRGPRITRYEVVPARGVKVNAITSLYNDICLNLAKEGVRMEAPIPGKSAIGFEIPNKRPKNVRLRELLECDDFHSAKSKTFVAIGKDVAGNPVFGDISKYPHALICGATGMGKSVCINSILISMLYRVRPDEVKLIMVDPKKVEFKMYSGIPHLLIPVITESKQAAGALMWAVEEMERRYELIEKHNVRNLDAYNERVAENPSIGEKLAKIVIVIDELADLMMMVRDPVEDLIMRIAQKARAAGIHLIIGTQRPSVQVITGSIKANIPTRMSCKVTSQVDSRTVFDNAGAEKLLDRGDMLYSTVDRPKPSRVQGAFVSDKEVENIMEFLKSQSVGDSYDDEVFAEINKAAQKCGNKKSGGGAMDDDGDDGEECGYYSDQQFLDAVELAIRSKKVSTSLLQRKLSIGYGKAAKYIDAMEEIGIVSEPKGQKPRDVLLSMDEWHEKLSRVEFD